MPTFTLVWPIDVPVFGVVRTICSGETAHVSFLSLSMETASEECSDRPTK